MTAPNPSSDTPHDCVGHCVGTASETRPPGPRTTTASVGPSPYGDRRSRRTRPHCVGTHCVTASRPTHTHTPAHTVQTTHEDTP